MDWLRFVIKFLLLYFLFYFATLAVTGLSASGGRFYSPFIEKYFNYPYRLRSGLLHTTAAMLELAGYRTEIIEPYKVRMVNGRGVDVVYSCLATSIISFWMAFVIAFRMNLQRKIIYFVAGSLMIFILNALRLALVVIAANGKATAAFVDMHHLFFNITVYIVVCLMMYRYGKKMNVVRPGNKHLK